MFCSTPPKSASFATIALVAWGLVANIAFAQEPDPRQLLEQMSKEIASLDKFIITGDAYADARLDNGLIVEDSSQATMRVRKPDAVRITNTTADEVKELYFGSGVLSLYTQSRNFYGQIEIPKGAEEALDYATGELGVDAPMIDFISGDVAKRILAEATDVQYIGKSLIRDVVFEQVAIRTPEIDIQLWIAVEGRHLPGKMALSAKWDGGAPRTVIFMEWDTDPDFPTGDMKFEPPEGAIKISFDSQIGSEEQ